MYLVYQCKAQTNFKVFKEHIETTAFQKLPITSCDYQATLEAQHGAQMPIEEDNVPPTNFQRLDSGGRTRGQKEKQEAQRWQRKLKKRKKTVQLKQLVCSH